MAGVGLSVTVAVAVSATSVPSRWLYAYIGASEEHVAGQSLRGRCECALCSVRTILSLSGDLKDGLGMSAMCIHRVLLCREPDAAVKTGGHWACD